MGKRILLFGPPGAGKGTHSTRLARDLGIPHVATGDMFRQAVTGGTELGRAADDYIRRGELVPDELVFGMLEERLSRPDAVDGYLLDGFPRTLAQAQLLASRLAEHGARMDVVLSLEAPEEMLVTRLSGRFTCRRCQATYNRVYRPARVEGTCDQCEAKLSQRPDDGEEAVRKRLQEYQAKTTPVLQFFLDAEWPVRCITSVGEVDTIYSRIREAAVA